MSRTGGRARDVAAYTSVRKVAGATAAAAACGCCAYRRLLVTPAFRPWKTRHAGLEESTTPRKSIDDLVDGNAIRRRGPVDWIGGRTAHAGGGRGRKCDPSRSCITLQLGGGSSRRRYVLCCVSEAGTSATVQCITSATVQCITRSFKLEPSTHLTASAWKRKLPLPYWSCCSLRSLYSFPVFGTLRIDLNPLLTRVPISRVSFGQSFRRTLLHACLPPPCARLHHRLDRVAGEWSVR